MDHKAFPQGWCGCFMMVTVHEDRWSDNATRQLTTGLSNAPVEICYAPLEDLGPGIDPRCTCGIDYLKVG